MTLNVNYLRRVLAAVSNADDFMAGLRFALANDSSGTIPAEYERSIFEIDADVRRILKEKSQ
ncbi:MAG: hypothetical protein EOP84_30660 [Verrucomicrobiaceae bacterium]|nr:MAG: hypothetical protein EOP84_30660 [Verrucomicrobiaceae bacterium]